MDCHSRLEALSCFHGKPPALRGLLFISKEFPAESGEGTLCGLFQAWNGFFPH